MLIGVVSDTHGYLDPRLVEAFSDVELILHAGDVGSARVLDGLRAIAPVHAVQGNNDVPLGGFGLQATLDIDIDGVSVHLVHQLPHANPRPETSVVVFGHSHRQVCEWRAGILYLNPGAGGRRGFHTLQTAALMRIDHDEVVAESVILGPRLK